MTTTGRVQTCGTECHYHVVSTHSIRRWKAGACASASSVSWCGGAGGAGETSVPTESSSRSSSTPPVDSTTSQPVVNTTHHTAAPLTPTTTDHLGMWEGVCPIPTLLNLRF